MLLEAAIFAPFNLVGFAHIPPALRPTVKGLLSFCFSVCLSLSC